MPPVLAVLPIIASIASIAGTGVGLGLELSNQPSSPKPVTPTAAQTADTANQTKQNQLASLSQQTPNIQAATGGSLSPDAWAQLSDILSGQAGSPGIGAANTDLITKLLSGNTGGSGVSAGSGAGSGTPGSSPGLTNSTFG